MKIITKHHTIFLLVGSTECGKTTFANEILIPQLKSCVPEKNYETNIQYLSSDAIRADLLGQSHSDKYDAAMMEVSGPAFDLLFAKLNAVTRFPVNADFVIVDTTGLSEEFRNQVKDLAKTHHYRLEVILFDYKNPKDYYASEQSKKLISMHVNRLRKDVIPTLRKSDFHAIHRIREKNFCEPEANKPNPKYTVEVQDRDLYLKHLLPNQYQYVVVGDVHECIEELRSLVLEHGFQMEEGKMKPNDRHPSLRFVLVGDFLDKGKNTEATIRFLYDNQDYFYLVRGNHENFVWKFLHGEIETKEEDKDWMNQYFDSLMELNENESLQHMLSVLYHQSRDFYRYIGKESSGFYVTHAPCENRYIGKLDPVSRKRQRKFSTDFNQELEEQLGFLAEEGEKNHPFHFFGHVATQDVLRTKNKVGIDTGCVYGNRLTSVKVEGSRLFLRSVPSQKNQTQELTTPFAKQEKQVKLHELGEGERKRLQYILRRGINYISGTMSPSDKDMDNGELESFTKGLDYYREKGINKVVLQPKYMGSRCNLYLFNQIEDCYATSRNGYIIQQVDLAPLYSTLLNQFSAWMKEEKIHTLVLDGELLPWRALGKGLIDHQFQVVEKGVGREISYLKEHGFEKALGSLFEQMEKSGFKERETVQSKKEWIEQIGSTRYQSYKEAKGHMETHQPLLEHESAFWKFQEQLRLYGGEQELEFKPFHLLKIVYENGEERIPTEPPSILFPLVSQDPYCVVDVTEPLSVQEGVQFFHKLTTDKKMEGVVIKPEQVLSGMAPFLKVRNPSYLTLVYGYDYQFPHKYQKLLKQKQIGKKIKTSIAEYQLGLDMLRFPIKELHPANEAFKQTVANLLFEESREKELDPRL